MSKKVLLIKRGAMGDILMTMPMVRQLKSNYPDISIDYCISNSFKSILIDNIYMNKVITLPDSYFSIRGVFQFIRFLFTIRQQYTYVIVLGKSQLYNLLIKSIMSAKIIGFQRGNLLPSFLDYAVRYDNVYKYQVIYYLELLKGFTNIKIDYNDLNFDFYNSYSLPLIEGEYIVLTNSGGNNQFEQTGLRMLPEQFMVSLIKQLVVTYKVILLGGECDYDNYQRYVTFVDHPNLYNYAGVYDLKQSIDILRHSTYFITTDCGAMHLGLVANIQEKMLCLFGPTNHYHILPPNFQGLILWYDYDIYDINYQLYGKTSVKYDSFFSKVTVHEISVMLNKTRIKYT